jgi:uncharacterized membrane protein SpoIIM required for sporulation
MQHRSGGLASLVLLHLGTFTLAGMGGWLRATGSLAARHEGVFLDDAVRIASSNIGVLAYLVVTNVLLVGIVGVVLFAVHGYFFGQMLAMTIGPVAWVWLYAPIEILAFAMAASASIRVALELVNCLRSGKRVSVHVVRELTMVFVVAVFGLLTAAILEALAIQGAWG